MIVSGQKVTRLKTLNQNTKRKAGSERLWAEEMWRTSGAWSIITDVLGSSNPRHKDILTLATSVEQTFAIKTGRIGDSRRYKATLVMWLDGHIEMLKAYLQTSALPRENDPPLDLDIDVYGEDLGCEFGREFGLWEEM